MQFTVTVHRTFTAIQLVQEVMMQREKKKEKRKKGEDEESLL